VRSDSLRMSRGGVDGGCGELRVLAGGCGVGGGGGVVCSSLGWGRCLVAGSGAVGPGRVQCGEGGGWCVVGMCVGGVWGGSGVGVVLGGAVGSVVGWPVGGGGGLCGFVHVLQGGSPSAVPRGVAVSGGRGGGFLWGLLRSLRGAGGCEGIS